MKNKKKILMSVMALVLSVILFGYQVPNIKAEEPKVYNPGSIIIEKDGDPNGTISLEDYTFITTNSANYFLNDILIELKDPIYTDNNEVKTYKYTLLFNDNEITVDIQEDSYYPENISYYVTFYFPTALGINYVKLQHAVLSEELPTTKEIQIGMEFNYNGYFKTIEYSDGANYDVFKDVIRNTDYYVSSEQEPADTQYKLQTFNNNTDPLYMVSWVRWMLSDSESPQLINYAGGFTNAMSDMDDYLYLQLMDYDYQAWNISIYKDGSWDVENPNNNSFAKYYGTAFEMWVVFPDLLNPVINGKTDYITNVNNPISESDIKAGLYAIDNVDGNIPSTSFVLVSDGYTANKNILGTYDIVYKVSDSAGNESQVTVKVHVVDVTKPIINGQNTYTIVYNQTQSLTAVLNSLTVTDNYQSGIIPVLVEDNYTANKAIKGSYTVKYKATDNSGNESDLFVVTINVVDTIKPVITGTSSYTRVYNNKLELATIKAALTATDGYDGNITANITLKSDNYTANYNKKGSYQVVYTVKDSSNNSIDYTVTINVIDNIKPIISGQAIYNTGSQVQLSEATIRAALTAVDDYDGALDLQLVSNGYSSHYEEIRSHRIVYKATDASGNVTEYSVTINVYDDVPPVIYTNDAFINIDGTLNYTLQQIIDHLIRVGDLQASVNFDNYYVSTSDYDPSTPGQYEVVLMRSDLAPESLKERVSVGIRVLESNPIPINPDPTPDESSTPVNIWPYFVGTFIAGIFIIAFINRKKR